MTTINAKEGTMTPHRFAREARTERRRCTVAAVIGSACVLALALTGCATDKPAAPAAAHATPAAVTAPAAESFTEADVVRKLDLSLTSTGAAYTTPTGCEVAVVLDTAEEVAMYRDAGDVVLTNPAGNVGVKVVALPDACRGELETGLAGLGS